MGTQRSDGWRATARIRLARPRPGGALSIRPPVASGDAVFVGEGFDRWMKCLRRDDLGEVWHVVSKKRWAPYRAWSTDVLLVSSYDGEIGGCDPRTGAVRWSHAAPEEQAFRWRDVLLIKNGPLRLVDVITGEVRDSIDVGWPENAIAVCGDRVLSWNVPGAPVEAYDLTERRTVWRRDLVAEIAKRYLDSDERGQMGRTPSTLPGLFIASLGNVAEGCLYGCSLEDGRIVWRAPVPASYGMTLYEGRIYQLLLDRFVAVDEATGEVVVDVTYPELEGCRYPQFGAIDGALIAFSTQSGHLAVFGRHDGRLLASYRHRTSLCGATAVDGRLLVTTGDGYLLVFALGDLT